jgi:hypothetical protein
MSDKRLPNPEAMSRAALAEHMRRYHDSDLKTPASHSRVSAVAKPLIRHGHRPMLIDERPHPDWKLNPAVVPVEGGIEIADGDKVSFVAGVTTPEELRQLADKAARHWEAGGTHRKDQVSDDELARMIVQEVRRQLDGDQGAR